MNRRIHNIGRRLLAGLAVVCFSGVLWGQIKDTVVRGQVTDSSGAVVPAIAVTLIGSAVVLAAVGAFAGWLPAYRASRIDPAEALRES